MSMAKAEVRGEARLDILKWIAVWVLLGGAMFGFYYFSAESLLLRVLGLLIIAGVAVLLAVRTEKGRFALDFMRETQTEVRKVVWPTRQETVQTTGVVVFMVILIALMIWAIDSILFWIVQKLTA